MGFAISDTEPFGLLPQSLSSELWLTHKPAGRASHQLTTKLLAQELKSGRQPHSTAAQIPYSCIIKFNI
jgi:hypothetical protein